MTLRILVFALFSFALGALLFAASAPATSSVRNGVYMIEDNRAADAAAIRAHIESICQAFIDWDVDKIYATHSEDWRGFLDESRVPIKGIDEYMRANEIDWPKSKGSKPHPNPSRGFRLEDFDVAFHGADFAVVNFNLEFFQKPNNAVMVRLRIMDVYAKRNGNWIQVASHTVVDPAWRAEQITKPMSVTPQTRQRILAAREAVWKAFFTNDRAVLEKLIPNEAIAINDGSEHWSNRDAILAEAKGFADSGAKLVKLEFPKTEMQVYGDTVIIYTTYLYELDVNGKRETKAGRGTEMFVRRGEDFVNVGWHLDESK